MTGFKKVFIDTAPFIYYIEGNAENPKYSDKVEKFLRISYETGIELVSSVITVEEYKVFPYRTKNYEYIESFDRLIHVLDIQFMNISNKIADKAAKIRAEYRGFKAMDALQLASACLAGCDLFLTNDKQLRQFKEIKCIAVEELE